MSPETAELIRFRMIDRAHVPGTPEHWEALGRLRDVADEALACWRSLVNESARARDAATWLSLNTDLPIEVVRDLMETDALTGGL